MIPPHNGELWPDWRWRKVRAACPAGSQNFQRLVDACIDIGLKPQWDANHPERVQRRNMSEAITHILRCTFHDPDIFQAIRAECLTGEHRIAKEHDMDALTHMLFQCLFMDTHNRLDDETWVREYVYLPGLLDMKRLGEYALWPIIAREYGSEALDNMVILNALRVSDLEANSGIQRIRLLGRLIAVKEPSEAQARQLIHHILGPEETSRFMMRRE